MLNLPHDVVGRHTSLQDLRRDRMEVRPRPPCSGAEQLEDLVGWQVEPFDQNPFRLFDHDPGCEPNTKVLVLFLEVGDARPQLRQLVAQRTRLAPFAWIELLSDLSAGADFRNEYKSVVRLDDPLDLRKLVPRQNEEPVSVRADVLVLLDGERDLLVARLVHAFADECCEGRVPRQVFGSLVDLAEQALVLGRTFTLTGFAHLSQLLR
jgi:hypothetical protein